MKINKIKINSFGKLRNKEIEFKNGINILYGENESGKSTIMNFIKNTLYGISKNKKGKEISDYDKYKPWGKEEFSGKLEYTLDNNEKYEIYRDFNKKNPKIYNENSEDISKEFNINKKTGNEFFYEQTKVDEELFLSTVGMLQSEIKLEKNNQNILVQKLANLASTGDDNVSYKRAIERINRRQLDEIGTDRSKEKPINLLKKQIQDLEINKINLEQYQNKKYEIEENEKKLLNDLNNLKNENNYYNEIKLLIENKKIEKEKINIKENINKFDSLFVCNPNNPNGKVKNLEKLLDIIVDNNKLLIVDETFMEFVEEEEKYSLVKYVEKYPNLFILKAVTKFFGLPGIRLGYGLTSNNDIIEKIYNYKEPWTINSFADTLSNYIFKDQKYIEDSKEYYIDERNFMLSELKSINSIHVYDTDTNFILIRLNDKRAKEIKVELLREGNILIRDASNFIGLDDRYIRIAIKSHKENELLIRHMKKLLGD